MNNRLPVWSHKKIAMQNYGLTADLRRQLGEVFHGQMLVDQI